MSSPWISALRSVALEVPDLRRALAFYADVWRLDVAARTDEALYLRGAGDDHHLLALHVSVGAPRIRYITLRAHDRAALHAIAQAAERTGGTILSPVAALKDDPARGVGLTLKDIEGRVFQIVCEDKLHASYLDPTDRPVRLAHAVLNARDLETTQRFVEDVFGFVLSDRTRLMAFMNCNRDHHTLALGTAENNALNHIAFMLPTLDAVMRGAGRMRDHGYPIEWGPGRHGPGNNIFSYFIDPFGIVIEYTAEVTQVDASYRPRGPADWAWPTGRLDQWGLAVGPSQRLREAQQHVLFAPTHTSDSTL